VNLRLQSHSTEFSDGPQFGTSYRFRVFAITLSGTPRFFGPIDTPPVLFLEGDDSIEKTSTPTPTIPENRLIVTDSKESHRDISGESDFDLVDERSLNLRWDFDFGQDISDYHVYVYINEDQSSVFLGRTASGDINELDWSLGSTQVIFPFRDGPVFGESYRFRIFAINRSGTPRFFGPFENEGVIEFLEGEDAEEPTPVPPLENPPTPTPTQTQTPVPDIPLNSIIVSDTLETFEDLSNSQDFDLPNERLLAIQWNFEFEEPVKDIHVYLIEDDNLQFSFLGRTGSGEFSFFEWRAGAQRLNAQFRDGPKFNRRYQFLIFALTESGSPRFFGPFFTNGAVEFLPDNN